MEKTKRIDPRDGLVIEYVSTGWMIVEAVGSLFAGILASSTALEAFGIDSLIEIVAGATLIWRLRKEVRGGTEETILKAEKVSSWIVGVGLLCLAGYIVISAGIALLSGKVVEGSIIGLVVMGISSVLMPYLAYQKRKIGKAIGSKALESDGFCSMVCAYMSWTVLAGIIGTFALGWWWIDAVAALGIVYFVVKEGLEAIESARSPMDFQSSCCKKGNS
jgi:divalent metal cation (Fe/Co/Zn/Cd) transporter